MDRVAIVLFGLFLLAATPAPPTSLRVDGLPAPEPDPVPVPEPAPGPNSGSEPAWVTSAVEAGWRVGQWLRISGGNPTAGYGLTPTNTAWQANQEGPRPEIAVDLQTVISSWSGAALGADYGTHGTYFVGPGSGHGDPAINQVYSFDLGTRTWTEEYPGGSGSIDKTFGHYGSDNSPISMHTYGNLQWVPGEGVWLYKTVDNWGQAGNAGDNNRYPHVWNPFTQSWAVKDSIPNNIWSSLNSQWDFSSTAYDPSRHRMYVHVSGTGPADLLGSLDLETQAWTKHSNPRSAESETKMVVDPVRDILLFLDMRNGWVWQYKELSDPNGPWQSVADSGTRPPRHSQSSWEFSRNLDGIVYLSASVQSGGTGAYLARWVSGGNGAKYTLQWSRIDGNGGSVAGRSGGTNGIHNRFRIMRWGEREIGVIVNYINGPVSALRLN